MSIIKKILLINIAIIDTVIDSNFYRDTVWFHVNSVQYIDPKTPKGWMEFIKDYPKAYISFMCSMRQDRKATSNFED